MIGNVEIVGLDGVHRMLQAYTQPKLTRRLQNAINESAKVFVPPLRSEARRVSRRMGRAVVAKQSYKGIRGAHDVQRGEPHMHIGFRIRDAWFSHMVIGGTMEHGPRRKKALRFQVNGRWVTTRRVRGVLPNPMLAIVALRNEGRFMRSFNRELDRSEGRR